jgi:sulfur carrier protein ThiS
LKLRLSFFGPIRRPWPEASREVEIEAGSTLEQVLVCLGYQAEDLKRVALVVNGKKRPGATELQADDDVRVVLLAGGG